MSHSPTKDWRWPAPTLVASEAVKPGEMLILPADPWGALTEVERREVLKEPSESGRIAKVADILVRTGRAKKVTGLG